MSPVKARHNLQTINETISGVHYRHAMTSIEVRINGKRLDCPEVRELLAGFAVEEVKMP